MNRVGLDVGLLHADRRLLALEPLLGLGGRFLYQASHDHRGARGDRRPGVRNERGVLRSQGDLVQPYTQRVGGKLTKDGLRPLPDLGRSREDAERAVRQRFHCEGTLKLLLAAPREPRAVENE